MLKDVEIVIRENLSSELPEYDNCASVALKYRIGDDLYGQVIRVNKPTLTAQDVVAISNALLNTATLISEALDKTVEKTEESVEKSDESTTE